jgi:hypothetical protein
MAIISFYELLLTISPCPWKDNGFHFDRPLLPGFRLHQETSDGRLDVSAEVRKARKATVYGERYGWTVHSFLRYHLDRRITL